MGAAFSEHRVDLYLIKVDDTYKPRYEITTLKSDAKCVYHRFFYCDTLRKEMVEQWVLENGYDERIATDKKYAMTMIDA